MAKKKYPRDDYRESFTRSKNANTVHSSFEGLYFMENKDFYRYITNNYPSLRTWKHRIGYASNKQHLKTEIIAWQGILE